MWRELLKPIAINAKPSATDYKVDRKHWQWDDMVEPLFSVLIIIVKITIDVLELV